MSPPWLLFAILSWIVNFIHSSAVLGTVSTNSPDHDAASLMLPINCCSKHFSIVTVSIDLCCCYLIYCWLPLLLVGYFFMLFLWSLSALHAVVVTNPLFCCCCCQLIIAHLIFFLCPVTCCMYLLLSPSLHRQLPMLLELPCEAIATSECVIL